VQYGVDTDGDINGWTHLSDLKIPSSNWIYGRDYAPIEPERFQAIFTRLNIGFQDLVCGCWFRERSRAAAGLRVPV
jgi:hypothetical protein